MVINYFGGGCFRLQSGELSLLINPANNRLKADVIVKTLTLADTLLAEREIAFPGEYELKGIEIKGLPLAGESTSKFIKTVYAVVWDDMKFVLLGHLSKTLEPDLVEELGEPDILFIPTGDDHFLPQADAAKLIKQLSPAVVIPAYYGATASLKAWGEKREVMEKFVCRKKDLLGAKGRMIVLEAKGGEKE